MQAHSAKLRFLTTCMFLLQVGDTDTDHARWCRPETDCLRLEGPYRPTWPVNMTWKGSDIVGEAAASLAAVSYMIKQDEPVSSAAESMLAHAKQLYAFGKAMNASWQWRLPLPLRDSRLH
jgi:hypothetical protein